MLSVVYSIFELCNMFFFVVISHQLFCKFVLAVTFDVFLSD